MYCPLISLSLSLPSPSLPLPPSLSLLSLFYLLFIIFFYVIINIFFLLYINKINMEPIFRSLLSLLDVKQYYEEIQRQQLELTRQQQQNITGKKQKANGHVKEEPNGADVAHHERKKMKVEGDGGVAAQAPAAVSVEIKKEEVKKEDEVVPEFEGEAAPPGN
jgi:hypothetical protein